MKTFWMVLGGGIPVYRHGTEDQARNEAARLAALHPGEEFFVLKAIAMCKKSDVQWSILTPEPGTEIPF